MQIPIQNQHNPQKAIKASKKHSKMPPRLLMLSLILTFSTVMQQTLAEATTDATCSRQQCENGCPSIPISYNASFTDLIEKSFTLTNHRNHSVTCLCPKSCRRQQRSLTKNCIFSHENKLYQLQHFSELKNPHEPCETFFCNNGSVATHMTLCAAINCPLSHRIHPADECCEICDTRLSPFCDGHHDCAIGCRHGFVRDVDNSCDLCRCLILSKTTTTTAASSTSADVDENEQKNFLFFTSESDLVNYLIVAVLVVAVVAFACFLAFVIWFLHRRFYHRVPLISHRSYKTTEP